MPSNSPRPPKSFMLAAMPLFLVLFIDSMGLGLVFPILNNLIFDPNAHFIALELTASTRNLLYGLTIGTFMFCWFFGAAILGELSDQIGRKKSLLICLLGAFVGYLFSAIAVVLHSFTLLLIGRIIAGFTAGSQSIAQAAIVDLSKPEHKAKNLGLILFFSSLGFVFGPIIGGVLSESSIVHWFNFAVPFYFAAAISILNSILLLFLFRETFLPTQKIHFKFNRALDIFISAFKHENIRELSIIFLIMMFGWSGLYSFISMYLLKVRQFNGLQIGLYMGLLGVGFGLGCGFFTEIFTNRYSLKQCVMGGCIGVGIGTLLTIMAHNEIYIWLASFMISIPISIAYSTILTLFSNHVSANAQGWIMGVSGAVSAFAFGMNGLLGGILVNISAQTPLIISIVCFAFTAILMKQIFQEKTAEATS